MVFKLFFLSLIVVIEVFHVNAAISPSAMFIKQRAEEALQEQILKSKTDISSCHNYYSEILKTLLEDYDEDIKQCENTENQQLLELSNAGQQARDVTTESLNNVCESIIKCEAESENLNFFDCVNTSGDDNTRAVWKASRESSDTAAHIREQIHVIKFQTDKCTSEAERVYIVGTTKATDDMIACYANGGLIPPSIPSADHGR